MFVCLGSFESPVSSFLLGISLNRLVGDVVHGVCQEKEAALGIVQHSLVYYIPLPAGVRQ